MPRNGYDGGGSASGGIVGGGSASGGVASGGVAGSGIAGGGTASGGTAGGDFAGGGAGSRIAGGDLRGLLDWAWGIPPALTASLEAAEEAARLEFPSIESRAAFNQLRLLHIFQQAGVTDFHLNGSTGYGYGDLGREALEAVFAAYFGGEAALVRAQIISGTHALALGLFASLRPGDELISAAGAPYDTLLKVIGLHGEPDSLLENGVIYNEMPPPSDAQDWALDLPRLVGAVGERTKVVFFQRSKGYQWRPSITMTELKEAIAGVKAKKPGVVCIVDNCYCEMADTEEPGSAGADLVIGSLTKNPGGTLAPMGGYIVGKKSLIEACARRLYAPGLSPDMGASLGFTRLAFQGFFQAPHVVGEALKGAVLAAEFFGRQGYDVLPDRERTAAGHPAPRPDIVQAVKLGDEGKLIRFCQAIQRACPLDAAFSPEPAMLPGYAHPVIMAGGSFVQGASSELSADGPLRPPYAAYIQGGFSLAQIRLGLLLAAKALASGGN
jgi:cystathionine beta-lyase family protein involved in aluminum resistance